MKFPEGDVQAFQAILVKFLEGEDLVANEIDLALDFLPGLSFQIGDLGLEPQRIGQLPPRRAGRPADLSEETGQNHLFLFKFGKIFPGVVGKCGKFPLEQLNGLTPKEGAILVRFRRGGR